MAGHDVEEHHPGQRRDHGRRAAELDPGELGRVGAEQARAGRQHEQREQQQHDQQVEQAFEDDGRERRRSAEPLAPGQHVRPNHFAGPGRQQETGRESDHRGAEGDAEPGAAEGRQQVLPAEGPERIRGERRRQGQEQRERVGAPGFGPHAAQVGVAKRKREQPHREQQDEDGANAAPHVCATVGLESVGKRGVDSVNAVATLLHQMRQVYG